VINYDFKAFAADAVKAEIRLSLLSLPFQLSATRSSFLCPSFRLLPVCTCI